MKTLKQKIFNLHISFVVFRILNDQQQQHAVYSTQTFIK